MRLLPPRPDYGAAGVAATVYTALYLAGKDPVASGFAALLAAILVLPLLFMARELTVFRATRVLGPQEAGTVAEWIAEAGTAVGVREGITVLYAFRKGFGLQVMQLGQAVLDREESQFGIVQLMHRAAWNASPAATRTRKGRIVVAVPGRVMEFLYQLAGRSRGGVYMRVSSAGHVKLVYTIIKEIAKAANQGAGRVYLAYLATKAFVKMMLRGWIRIDDRLVQRIDKIVPPEPPWVRSKIARQLSEEARLAVAP